MPPELAEWIPAAVIIVVMLYLHRTTRQDMKQLEARLHEGMKDLRGEVADLRDHVDTQIGNLRDRMDTQNGDLRDRMGRIEGNLDVLREYFVRDGRGTAA